jgi:type III restriction enzyme
LSLKVGAEDFVRATEASIQSLLPIHAYSQKQLSSVSVRLDELSRFVTAPIRQLLELKDRDVLALSNRLRENYASLQRFRSLGDAISRNELDERSQADQASHLRSTLSGLSAEDQQQLDSRPIVDRAREVSHRWQRATDEAERDVQELIGRIDSAASLTSAPPTEAAGELRRDLDAAYDDVTRSLQTLKQSLQQALAAFTAMRAGQGAASARRALEERLEALDTAYTAVKQRSTAHAEQLAQLAAIEKRRADIASELERLRSERISLGDPKDAHVQLRAELNALTVERSDLLAKQCEVVTELSGGLLRATLSRGRGLGGVQERFRGLASGSGTRASKIEAFFAALAKETDPLATWELCLAELEALLLVPDGEDFTSELTPTLSRLGLNVADQQRVRTRMTVDSWLDLALTPVVDEPVFEYRTKEDTYIAFESASAGQQATALLRVLLSQSGMPLIIDQPEEDLDSQVVQEVVEWLWTAKSKRQVIFASHNANLVVNGDAELVVICDYRRSGDQSGGKVKLQGAIDIPEIRSEITKVMEGGEKAFRLRKEKYGF